MKATLALANAVAGSEELDLTMLFLGGNGSSYAIALLPELRRVGVPTGGSYVRSRQELLQGWSPSHLILRQLLFQTKKPTLIEVGIFRGWLSLMPLISQCVSLCALVSSRSLTAWRRL